MDSFIEDVEDDDGDDGTAVVVSLEAASTPKANRDRVIAQYEINWRRGLTVVPQDEGAEPQNVIDLLARGLRRVFERNK